MLKALALLSLSLSTLPIARAAHAEAPAALKVVKAQAAGNGCPTGHAFTAAANGVDALTIDIPAVKAALDGAKKLDREACSMTLELAFDAGWQVAATELSVQTQATLGTGVVGEASFDAHFQGKAANATGAVSLGGTAPSGALVALAPTAIALAPADLWSPCGSGATLVGRLALKVQATGARDKSLLATAGPATLKLAWKRCAQ